VCYATDTAPSLYIHRPTMVYRATICFASNVSLSGPFVYEKEIAMPFDRFDCISVSVATCEHRRCQHVLTPSI
jgi:hypothetical protein